MKVLQVIPAVLEMRGGATENLRVARALRAGSARVGDAIRDTVALLVARLNAAPVAPVKVLHVIPSVREMRGAARL